MPFKLGSLLNKKDSQDPFSSTSASPSPSTSTNSSTFDGIDPGAEVPGRRSSIASIASSIKSLTGQGQGQGQAQGKINSNAPPLITTQSPSSRSRTASGSSSTSSSSSSSPNSATAAGEYRQQVLEAEDRAQQAQDQAHAQAKSFTPSPGKSNSFFGFGRIPRSPSLSINTTANTTSSPSPHPHPGHKSTSTSSSSSTTSDLVNDHGHGYGYPQPQHSSYGNDYDHDFEDLQTPLATGREGMSFPIISAGFVGGGGMGGPGQCRAGGSGNVNGNGAGGVNGAGKPPAGIAMSKTDSTASLTSTSGLGGGLPPPPMTAPPTISGFGNIDNQGAGAGAGSGTGTGSGTFSPVTIDPPRSAGLTVPTSGGGGGGGGLTVPSSDSSTSKSRRLSNASARSGGIGAALVSAVGSVGSGLYSAPATGGWTGGSSSGGSSGTGLHPNSANAAGPGIGSSPLTTVSSNRSDLSYQSGHTSNPLDLLVTAKDKVKDKVQAAAKKKSRSRRGSSSAGAGGNGGNGNRLSYVEDEDGNIVQRNGNGNGSGNRSSSISSRRNSRIRSGSDGSALGGPTQTTGTPLNKESTAGLSRSRGLSVNSTTATRPTNLLSEDDEDDLDGTEDDDESVLDGPGRTASTYEYGNDGERSSMVSSRGDSLAVTGFAVASNRRNVEFHGMFPEVDEGDYLIEDYGCAMQKDILHQGRIYLSENHICFYANIFGWVTNVVLPFSNVVAIEKKMTAFVIPNAIAIVSRNGKVHTFASFISRDTTYDTFINVWRHSRLDADSHTGSSEESVDESYKLETENPADGPVKVKSKGTPAARKPTACDCGKKGEHYSETMLDAVFPTSPEKAFHMLFKSQFLDHFMKNDQLLTNVSMSEFSSGDIPHRDGTYVKPLSGAIGPSKTRCDLTDDIQHNDPDHYISVYTVTKTPEVPSGHVFSVVTKSCFTWAGPTSCRVHVTTRVEWTGRSFIKGIIDRSAIDGQRSWHVALEKAARVYMKEHMDEFRVQGADGQIIEEEEVVPETAIQQVQMESPISPVAEKVRGEMQKPTQAQGPLGMVGNVISATGGAILALVELIGDIIRQIPMSKETALVILIFVLAMSNLWTYSSLKKERIANPEERRARRMSRLGLQESGTMTGDQIAQAIGAYLAAKPVEVTPVAGQVDELQVMLKAIEERAQMLQKHLAKGETRELQDLDTLE